APVPTSTGAIAAGNVGVRAATSQARAALRELRELAEVRLSLLDESIAAFLGLIADVVQERRVAAELCETRQPIGIGVERRLQQAERERTSFQQLLGPR